MKILNLKTPERLLGNYGEKQAAKYLKKNGYRVVKKNFVADTHEIDLIAETRDSLIFVEVKTRTLGHDHPNEPRPASSVTSEKQRGIISAAKIYTAFNPTEKKKRFDVIEVYVNSNNNKYSVAEIKHLINTFNINTAFSYRKELGK